MLGFRVNAANPFSNWRGRRGSASRDCPTSRARAMSGKRGRRSGSPGLDEEDGQKYSLW